jgi:broad-specificity NMP kinase
MAAPVVRCNVLVAGVPGVGKTSLSAQLAERLATAFPDASPPWQHIDVGRDVIQGQSLHDGLDKEYMASLGGPARAHHIIDPPTGTIGDVYVLNEDKVVDALEEPLWGTDAAPAAGHKIVDFHTVDFFPERWFQIVVLLRCINTSVLFDRLESRGYPLPKVQENVQAEIMDVVANEVRESYSEDLILELQSVVPSDVDTNIETIVQAVGKVIGQQPLPDPDA